MSHTEGANDGDDARAPRTAVAGTLPMSGNPAEDAASGGLRPGDVVGRYQIRSLLGVGGMGEVFTAIDPELGRPVALKLIRPDRRGTSSRARTRLLREAQALAKLQHPNVVTIHDVGTDGDKVFLAMELVAGPTLAEWLVAPRPWRAILDTFAAAGRGLAAAHAVGIIHRDFKPSNVIVGADRVVVVDFGLARAGAGDTSSDDEGGPVDVSVLDVNLTLTGERVGTLRYMAPEQLAGGAVTAHADQFAFATSLWTALYGAPPYPGLGGEVLDRKTWTLAPPPHGRKVPDRLRAALTRALAFAPGERWPGMNELLRELTRDPAAMWRKRLGVIALCGAAVAAPAAFLAGRRAPEDPCGGGARLAAAVWDDAARTRARAAFLATGMPSAGESFTRVDAAMGARVVAWTAAHRGTCEATRLTHVQSETLHDLRMACLERIRGELSAFGDALGRTLDAGGVGRAVSASARTLDLSSCSDADELTAAVRPPREPDALRRIAELGAEADRLQADVDLGRFKQALAQARELLPRARAAAFAPIAARVLVMAGRLEIIAGDVERGIDLLYQATVAAGQAHDDVLHARALSSLIRPVGTLRGRLDEAARVITLAEAAVARAGNGPDPLIYLYQQEGNYYKFARHDPQAALARYELALAIAQAHHGLDHLDVGWLLDSIATVERGLGRVADARAHYRRSMEIVFARLGPDNPSVSLVYNNLGALDQDVGNYEGAAELYQRDLELSERNYGAASEQTITPAANLAGVRLMSGRLSEARALAERALRVAEQALGPMNPLIAEPINVMATIAFEEDKLAESIAGHRRGIAIVEEALGGENPALVPNLIGLIDAELAAGHLAEARAASTRALAIAAKGSESSPAAAEAWMREGGVLARERRFAQAVAAYDRALALTEKVHGGAHPKVTAILCASVDALAGDRQADRALANAERALALAEGRGPLAAAEAEWAVARALAAKKDGPRAVAMARSARARVAGAGFARMVRVIDEWVGRQR